jgi:hypothetical protein
MNSASTVILNEKKPAAVELSITQEQLPITEAPELSPGAWKAIIFLLVGGVLFLAIVGAYVLSGLYRFQNCL